MALEVSGIGKSVNIRVLIRECVCVFVCARVYGREGSIIANETNTTPDRDRCLEMASWG